MHADEPLIFPSLKIALISSEVHPLAKTAKDIAAGAVISAAIISVIVGLLLFGPRLWALWQGVR